MANGRWEDTDGATELSSVNGAPLQTGKGIMQSRNARNMIRRVYDTVHMALWALLVAGAAFLLLHIPQMRDARAIAEAKRALEISQENKRYCEKWGMPAGTHEHIICTMDLDAIRAEVERRIVEENQF
jgi:hypothetical protein